MGRLSIGSVAWGVLFAIIVSTWPSSSYAYFCPVRNEDVFRNGIHLEETYPSFPSQIILDLNLGGNFKHISITNDLNYHHSTPRWSQNENFIAYVRQPVIDDRSVLGTGEIWVTNNVTHSPITNDPTRSDSYPVWSPNNDKIAFFGKIGGVENIYIVDVQTKEVTQVTNFVDTSHNFNYHGLKWDNHIILSFSMGEGLSFSNVFVYYTRSKQIVQVTNASESELYNNGIVSPDGKHILYNKTFWKGETGHVDHIIQTFGHNERVFHSIIIPNKTNHSYRIPKWQDTNTFVYENILYGFNIGPLQFGEDPHIRVYEETVDGKRTDHTDYCKTK